MISSKEIFEKTGISRATLNNYIKMGILPKPDVRRAGADQAGAKKIGFFPETAIERIEQVKCLKSEGLSMEEIAQRLSGIPIDEIDEPPRSRRLKDSGDNIAQGQIRGIEQNPLHTSELNLTVSDIDSPAYLVNRNYEIEWINTQAEELIFNGKIRSITDIQNRNIFRLMFDWQFHDHIKNWQELVALHMSFIKSPLSPEHFYDLYKGISQREVHLLREMYSRAPEEGSAPATSVPFNMKAEDGSHRPYTIHTMSFREGTFVVYIENDRLNSDILGMLQQRGKVIRELLSMRMPSLVSLCVLVADLQDSVRISAELPPEEYFELINGLWRIVGHSFEKFNGIYGKHAGDGMLYYFIKRPGINYVLNAIDCALELRERMLAFSEEWKRRKNWNNELLLNIAINEGQEFFGAIHSASAVEFTALGDSINYTGRLSDFARDGAIWTTKNVIAKLGHEDAERLLFGVYRRRGNTRQFIENSFSRIIDLLDKEDVSRCQLVDIAALPITEIIKKRDTHDV